MKYMFSRTAFVIFLLLFSATQAQANGFRLAEQGIRAMGMGNAFTAVADDASAMWYNPAGIAFLKGGNLMMGGIGIISPKIDFTSNSSNSSGAGITGNSDRKNFLIPHFHMTFTDPKMDMSYGLSVTSPFGLESDWTGSPLAPTTGAASLKSTTFSRLEMINVNPNIAFKVSDHISIAGGFDYVYIKDVDFSTSILTQNGSGDGWGGNIGLMYKGDLFSVGVTYRTQVAVRITGTSISSLGGKANSVAYMKLPELVNGGFSFHPSDTLTISAEADWTNWSKMDQIVFKYSSPLTLPVVGAKTTTVTQEEWHPTLAAKVGIEWKVQDDLRFRLGYNFDPSPVNPKNFSPGFPFDDRHLFTIGSGYDFTKKLTVDVAYMYVKQKDINQTKSTGVGALRNGTYKSSAHVFGLSANYTF